MYRAGDEFCISVASEDWLKDIVTNVRLRHSVPHHPYEKMGFYLLYIISVFQLPPFSVFIKHSDLSVAVKFTTKNETIRPPFYHPCCNDCPQNP